MRTQTEVIKFNVEPIHNVGITHVKVTLSLTDMIVLSQLRDRLAKVNTENGMSDENNHTINNAIVFISKLTQHLTLDKSSNDLFNNESSNEDSNLQVKPNERVRHGYHTSNEIPCK